jgi:hypothetical protein
MSHRKGDENILDIIKSLQARVERLENHGARTRRNDLRIGDLLISWNDTESEMTLTNLKTGGVPVTVHVP